MNEIEIEIYKTSLGRSPFESWLKKIKDLATYSKILSRLDRLRAGNFGDCKSLHGGICELRIHYGAGTRIYYAKIGNKIILLLLGGDKESQCDDIAKAKEYFKDYQSREKKYGKK